MGQRCCCWMSLSVEGVDEDDLTRRHARSTQAPSTALRSNLFLTLRFAPKNVTTQCEAPPPPTVASSCTRWMLLLDGVVSRQSISDVFAALPVAREEEEDRSEPHSPTRRSSTYNRSTFLSQLDVLSAELQTQVDEEGIRFARSPDWSALLVRIVLDPDLKLGRCLSTFAAEVSSIEQSKNVCASVASECLGAVSTPRQRVSELLTCLLAGVSLSSMVLQKASQPALGQDVRSISVAPLESLVPWATYSEFVVDEIDLSHQSVREADAHWIAQDIAERCERSHKAIAAAEQYISTFGLLSSSGPTSDAAAATITASSRLPNVCALSSELALHVFANACMHKLRVIRLCDERPLSAPGVSKLLRYLSQPATDAAVLRRGGDSAVSQLVHQRPACASIRLCDLRRTVDPHVHTGSSSDGALNRVLSDFETRWCAMYPEVVLPEVLLGPLVCGSDGAMVSSATQARCIQQTAQQPPNAPHSPQHPLARPSAESLEVIDVAGTPPSTDARRHSNTSTKNKDSGSSLCVDEDSCLMVPATLTTSAGNKPSGPLDARPLASAAVIGITTPTTKPARDAECDLALQQTQKDPVQHAAGAPVQAAPPPPLLTEEPPKVSLRRSSGDLRETHRAAAHLLFAASEATERIDVFAAVWEAQLLARVKHLAALVQATMLVGVPAGADPPQPIRASLLIEESLASGLASLRTLRLFSRCVGALCAESASIGDDITAEDSQQQDASLDAISLRVMQWHSCNTDVAAFEEVLDDLSSSSLQASQSPQAAFAKELVVLFCTAMTPAHDSAHRVAKPQQRTSSLLSLKRSTTSQTRGGGGTTSEKQTTTVKAQWTRAWADLTSFNDGLLVASHSNRADSGLEYIQQTLRGACEIVVKVAHCSCLAWNVSWLDRWCALLRRWLVESEIVRRQSCRALNRRFAMAAASVAASTSVAARGAPEPVQPASVGVTPRKSSIGHQDATKPRTSSPFRGSPAVTPKRRSRNATPPLADRYQHIGPKVQTRRLVADTLEDDDDDDVRIVGVSTQCHDQTSLGAHWSRSAESTAPPAVQLTAIQKEDIAAPPTYGPAANSSSQNRLDTTPPPAPHQVPSQKNGVLSDSVITVTAPRPLEQRPTNASALKFITVLQHKVAELEEQARHSRLSSGGRRVRRQVPSPSKRPNDSTQLLRPVDTTVSSMSPRYQPMGSLQQSLPHEDMQGPPEPRHVCTFAPLVLSHTRAPTQCAPAAPQPFVRNTMRGSHAAQLQHDDPASYFRSRSHPTETTDPFKIPQSSRHVDPAVQVAQQLIFHRVSSQERAPQALDGHRFISDSVLHYIIGNAGASQGALKDVANDLVDLSYFRSRSNSVASAQHADDAAGQSYSV